MDIRNPPFVPRYVIPSRPRVATIGITTVSPRNTTLPSVDELLDSHARVGAKLQREKLQNTKLGGHGAAQTSSMPIVAPQSLESSGLGNSGKSRQSRSAKEDHSSSSLSTPTDSISSPKTTKSLFAQSGVCGPYHNSALITSTLNDPSWFRFTKSSANSSSSVHHTNFDGGNFFGGIRPGAFPGISPRRQREMQSAAHASVDDNVHLPALASSGRR